MIVTLVRLFNFLLTPLGKCINKNVSDSYYHSKSSPKDEVVYSRRGNWFEIGATKFKVDVKTFTPLAADIAKDKNFVYFAHKPQPHVDHASFQVKGDVLQDKNHIYSRTNDYYTYQLEIVGASQ